MERKYKSQQERIEEYIMYQLKQAGCQGVSLGTLGNKIRNKFGNFKVRDYGYSQFQQYIKSFPDVDLKDDGEQHGAVVAGRVKGQQKTIEQGVQSVRDE